MDSLQQALHTMARYIPANAAAIWRDLLSRLHSRLTKVSTVSPSHLDPGSPAVFRYSVVASVAGIIRGNGLPPRDCFPRGAAVGACGGGDAGEERGGDGSRGIFGGDGGGVYGE